MMKRKANGVFSTWQFRREITLGTLLSLAALLGMVAATWGNLQKELALIRHELTSLIDASDRIHEQMGKLGDQCQQHEYRLGIMESRTVSSSSRPMLPGTIDKGKVHYDSEETSSWVQPEAQTADTQPIGTSITGPITPASL